MKPLVEVRDLKMHFPIYAGLLRRQVGAVKAVDGVSFSILEGETLGLVGESGCGKSTCGRAVLRLYDITDGEIVIDGRAIGSEDQMSLRRIRPTMQMVFQDPQASLNPRMTVGSIIGEPLDPSLTATRTNSRAGSASGSGSPARWRSSPSSSSATSPSRRSTCRSRRRW